MVRLGIETIIDDPGLLPGKKLGLITNSSGVTQDLTPTIDVLHEHRSFTLDRLFAPEHGIRGNAQADVDIEQTVDHKTNVPVHSLYGENGNRLEEKIGDLDALVYDMQDIGCRFYALIFTLIRALEAAAKTDTPVVVLDRPNPIAPLASAGNLAPPVGAFPVDGYELPIVHGLTVGELASYFNTSCEIGAQLSVIGMDGWHREDWYDQTGLPWVLPSPNMPTLSTATIYPGTCLFEGTNLSEGRGTTKPFELVGAPWVDAEEWAEALNECNLPGVGFRPAYFTPMFSKHERRDIEGVQVHILDRTLVNPVAVGVTMLASVFTKYSESDWLETGNGYFIDSLVGGKYLRKTLDEAKQDIEPDSIRTGIQDYWKADIQSFSEESSQYMRY